MSNVLGIDDLSDVTKRLFKSSSSSSELEKGGKPGQIGEVRTWQGKRYQKTINGWVPVSDPSKTMKDESVAIERKEKGVEDISNMPQATQNASLKKYLKETLNTKVSIKTDSFANGNSMNVKYDLGASEKVIDSVVDNLQYGDFDGQNDSYNYRESSGVIGGKRYRTFKYVSVKQNIPDSVRLQMIQKLSQFYNFDGAHEVKTMDDVNRRFDKQFGGARSWSEMLWRSSGDMNFVTQDPEKVNITSAYYGNDGNVHYNYEVDGKQYNTEQVPTKMRMDESTRESEIKEAKQKVEDYINHLKSIHGEFGEPTKKEYDTWSKLYDDYKRLLGEK